MNTTIESLNDPRIRETEHHRIVEGHVFVKHPAGSQGSPPPEVLAQFRAEEEKTERAALLVPMESPIAAAQRDLDEAAEFENLVAPFIGSVWLEKNPPKDGETIKFEVSNFFRGIRPNVMGEATARNEFLIRIAAVPFIETMPTPAPVTQTHGQRTRVVGNATPAKPIVERFPLSFFTLSEFLQKHRPEMDFDVTILETLAEPDRGHEHEQRIEPSKPPTIEESISRLVTALTAGQKPAAS